jgi:hypothetical protein
MMKSIMKNVLSMLAVTTWMIGCQDQNEGSSATAIEAQALQACLADKSCRDCYKECGKEDADEGECRDGCCRSHGGERVRAYCEQHGAACRDEGRQESCEAHEMRCPDGDRPDGGVGMRGGDHGRKGEMDSDRGEIDGDRGEMMDSDRGEWGPKTDTDVAPQGDMDGRPDREEELPEEE